MPVPDSVGNTLMLARCQMGGDASGNVHVAVSNVVRKLDSSSNSTVPVAIFYVKEAKGLCLRQIRQDIFNDRQWVVVPL